MESILDSISLFIKGGITMKRFLTLASHGSLIKAVITNDKDSMTLINDVKKNLTDADVPFEKFITPAGECKVYKIDNAWISVTDNIVVEVLDNETVAEVYYDFDDNIGEGIKDIAYLVICFIIGHIIIRDNDIYKTLISTYIENLVFNNYTTSFDIERYNKFIETEAKVNCIEDHVTANDLLYGRGVRSYIEPEPVIATSIVDVTELNNVFKIKDMFIIS